MIRPATHEDVETLVDLGELMHEESPVWSRLNYSRAKVAQLLHGLINSRDGLVDVASDDGVIVGTVLAIVDEHWSGTDLIAAELALYVTPDERGKLHAAQLILSMQGWATAMGAKLVRAGCSTALNSEATARLYCGLGFVRTEDVQMEYLCSPQRH